MDIVKLDQAFENLGFTVNKRLLGLIGVLELMISMAFTFLWIGYPLGVITQSFYIDFIYPLLFGIFCTSVVVTGTSLVVANQREGKMELYQIYIKWGVGRLLLEIFVLAKSYSPYFLSSFGDKLYPPKQAILWAITIESLLGLVLVYFRQRSVKSEATECPPHGGVCALGVIGLLEILASILFSASIITGLGEAIPISSLVCAPLWMGTAIFGALLIFNRMIKSTKMLKGYLIFAIFRLIIGIAIAVFLLRGLLEAINSDQPFCEGSDGLYYHYFCHSSMRKRSYPIALVILGVLFIIGVISIRFVYMDFKKHRKLGLKEEGNNDGKVTNIDRNIDFYFYRSQAKLELCPYDLSKNVAYKH